MRLCKHEKKTQWDAILRSITEVMQVQGMCFTPFSALCFSNWLAVIFVMACLLSVWKEIRLFAGIFLVMTQCYRWIAEQIDTDMGQNII